MSPFEPTDASEPDWVSVALAAARKLPPRSYGHQLRNSPSSLGTLSPKGPKPVIRSLGEEDFNSLLASYWKDNGAARQPIFDRACAWAIEAFLRARESIWGANLNHSISDLPKSTNALLDELAKVGLREELKPVCNRDVEKRYRNELCAEDLAKLTLWLHWQLVAEAVAHLITKRTFWWQDGDWILSVREADRVRRLRKRRVIAA